MPPRRERHRLWTATTLAAVTTAQLGDRRGRRDLLASQQQSERHLHDTAATRAARIDVGEADPFQFGDGARVNGHRLAAYPHPGSSRYVAALD
jgi:hypothetical protein